MSIVPTPDFVPAAFDRNGLRLRLDALIPVKRVSPQVYTSRKYAQIVASIKAVGLVEPPIVASDRGGTYLIVDGHIRINALRELGETEVDCLVAMDDEAFTYNTRLNRLTLVQEHTMIRQAIKRGASESKIAAALSMDLATLRQRNRLVDGICPEAVDMLKDVDAPRAVFRVLKRMRSVRQIEAAGLMVELNKFSERYAEALLAATPDSQLMIPTRKSSRSGAGLDQLMLLEREASNLESQYRLAEETYAQAQLNLVVARAYVAKLLNDAELLRHLSKHHIELLARLEGVCSKPVTAT